MRAPAPRTGVVIARLSTMEEAEQHALVLAASGIDAWLRREDGTVALRVREEDALAADYEIGLWQRENRPRRRVPLRSVDGRWGIESVLAWLALLLFFYTAQVEHRFGFDWRTLGLADAGLMLAGEWWRAVTALTLHGDFGHLLGNLGFGALFGLLVTHLLGPGLGWLAILASGALGNIVNAVIQGPPHAALGASTAIFGAIGILGGWLARRGHPRWPGGLRRATPLAAGVMFLFLLGMSGERTDIGAHVAGFIAGIAIGFAQAGDILPDGPRAQGWYGLAIALILALAWGLALSRA